MADGEASDKADAFWETDQADSVATTPVPPQPIIIDTHHTQEVAQTATPPPSGMIMGTVHTVESTPFTHQTVVQPQFKKLHAGQWMAFGIISCFFSLFGPSICCMVSGVGVIMLASSSGEVSKNPDHPEKGYYTMALILNILAIIIAMVSFYIIEFLLYY